MPMKHHGEAPKSKAEKKKLEKQDKNDTRALKAIQAKTTSDKPGKNDPRVQGK